MEIKLYALGFDLPYPPRFFRGRGSSAQSKNYIHDNPNHGQEKYCQAL